MIALLAGTLGVLGCDSDPATGNGGSGGNGTAGTGGSGTAGSGGNGTDACTGPLCDAAAAKEACNELIGECNRVAQVDIPEETCDFIGNEVFCEEGAGGTGGTGGAGGAGGTGGTGGTGVPTECDWTGGELCTLCDVSEKVPDCEAEFDACLLLGLGGNECEKCSGRALIECRE